ncbi:hypothetical protein Chor_005863, partial [Crotalus horridus]
MIDYRFDVRERSVEGILILPLYGCMPTDQQRRIFLPPPPGIRKCVVSEAVQRAGRAGRTASGKCFRVYNKEFWEQCMPDHMVPEIQRTSLTSVMLTLKCLAIHNVIRQGHVTKLGQLMVWLPLPPNLSCAVLKAASLGCDDLLLPIAAMLSVEKVFIHPGGPQKQKEAERRHQSLSLQMGGHNDFTTLLNIFEQCKASESPSVWCQENWVHWRAVKLAFSVEQQLREIVNRLKQLPDFLKEDFDGSRNEILRRCLCTGYFASVARRSAGKSFRTMDGHGSVAYIHPSSAVYLRTVCPIRYAWVQDLLPRLHQIDAYELSNVARENVTEEEMANWRRKEDLQKQNGELK